MNKIVLFIIVLILVACTPQVTVTSEVTVTSTPPPTLTSLPPPTQTATPEPLYSKTLFEESIVIPVEGEFGGLPVEVNIISHRSIADFQFSDITHVILREDKLNRYGETAETAIAHAVFQALAQAYSEGATAQTLVSLIKDNPNLEIPIWASNLDTFPTDGYKPEHTTFKLYNQETGEPNQINLVFTNVPSNKFPGELKRVPSYQPFGMGVFLDNEGNLYLFQNDYPKRAIYTFVGSEPKDRVTTNLAVAALESISWPKGYISSSELQNIYKGNTPIFKILSLDNSYTGSLLISSTD